MGTRRGLSRLLPLGATLATALAAGCLPSLGPSDFVRGPEPVALECCGEEGDPVRLRYLGVGGWEIRSERGLLLTAPFFSNPPMLAAGIGYIGFDSTAIVDGLAHVGAGDLSSASAILVGHAHYDHLMDVPWIAARLAPEAVVLGSRTARLQTLGLARRFGLSEDRLIDVGSRVADHDSPGEWIEVGDGAFRVLPILSDHAPHFQGHLLYDGERRVRPPIPEAADQWIEGLTYAWLIDVLDGAGETALRIYYQDAVAREPRGGLPPRDVLGDSIPVDLAILVPATYAEARWQPEWILESTRPEHVLLGHWENFFQPATAEVEPVAFTLLPDFIARLRRATCEGCWSLPMPGAVFDVR